MIIPANKSKRYYGVIGALIVVCAVLALTLGWIVHSTVKLIEIRTERLFDLEDRG